MIKSLIKNIIVFSLSLLMLFSGNGYALNKMECMKSGKLKVSFSASDDCCGANTINDCQVSSKCCKNITTFYKTSTFNNAREFHLIPVIIEITTFSHYTFSGKQIPEPDLYEISTLNFISPPPRILHGLLLI